MLVVWLFGLQHGLQPDNLLLAELSGGASAIGIPAFVAFAPLPPKPLHGSARLARPGEIARAKRDKAGAHSILLGRHRGKLLAFNGDLHPFLAAATRTGKGAGFLVPNLLHQWMGSGRARPSCWTMCAPDTCGSPTCRPWRRSWSRTRAMMLTGTTSPGTC